MTKINFKALIRLFTRGWRRTRTLTFSKRRWGTYRETKFKEKYTPNDLRAIFNLAKDAHKTLIDVKDLNLGKMKSGMTTAQSKCSEIVRRMREPAD